MAGGRPTLYDPEYCEAVVGYGREGMSVVEMAAEIGVARNTLETEWPSAHPEFLEAFTHARQLSQAWWERTGRVGMMSKGIDGGIWSRSMAARFPSDWREVKASEISGPGGKPVETLQRIERVLTDPANPDS
jgi:hypothetical protein